MPDSKDVTPQRCLDAKVQIPPATHWHHVQTAWHDQHIYLIDPLDAELQLGPARRVLLTRRRGSSAAICKRG